MSVFGIVCVAFSAVIAVLWILSYFIPADKRSSLNMLLLRGSITLFGMIGSMICSILAGHNKNDTWMIYVVAFWAVVVFAYACQIWDKKDKN